MTHYKKKPCGNGSHGMKFEVNLLLYYISKACLSRSNFKISNGIADEPKLDDIILETDKFKVFAQAKHVDNKQKKISKSQLFGQSGRYSLNVYLNSAYDIFKQMTNLIHVGNEEPEFSPNTFQQTKFHLVTNISPNIELRHFRSRSPSGSESLEYFEEIQEHYKFDTDESIFQLSECIKGSEIPNWFISMFLKNFHLIIIPDHELKAFNEILLIALSSRSEIPYDITQSKMYELIEAWQSKRDGVYLTRTEINSVFFSHIASEHFKRKLTFHGSFIDFDINILLISIKNNLVTTVHSSRYFLIFTMLQQKFAQNNTFQPLFVNPLLDINKQKFLISAFLHEKYTHLICVMQDYVEERISDAFFKVKQNEKFLKYKRMILICENKYNNTKIENIMLNDDEWFKKRNIKVNRVSNFTTNMRNYYIPRKLSYKNVSKSEEKFVKEVQESKNNVIVIVESAGMGKTSILQSLSDKINTQNYFWSIIIKLNQFTKLLEGHLNAKTVPQLHEFLHVLVKSTFDRNICRIPNILIVMVDGFDEVSPDYKNIVTEFLKNTRSMKNVKSVIVTSRRHLKGHLETNLNIDVYELEQLSTAEVCSLISKRGQYNLTVVEKWYLSLPLNIRDMLKNPLYATILAQTFLVSTISTMRLKEMLDLNMNLYEMYDAFLEKNKEIFINDKSNCQGNIFNKKILLEKLQQLMEFCMEFALEKTFKEDYLKELGITAKEGSAFGEEIYAYGILEKAPTSIVFVHETFKEFFLAKWVLREMFDSKRRNIKIIETILKDILMKFYQCKIFVEYYLRKNWNQLSDEILEVIGNIVSNDSRFFDMFYVNYEFPNIVKLMLEKSNNKSLWDSLFKNVVEFGPKALQPDIVLMLLQKNPQINVRNDKGKTILHITCENGNMELLKYLIEEKNCELDEEDKKGVTSLMLALAANNSEIFNYLITKGADINKLGTKIEIMFHNITNSLVIAPATDDTSFCSKNEANGLHIAAYNGNFNLIKLIVSKQTCSVHESTSDGWNALHCAVPTGNLDIIKFLVSLDINTDQVTNRSETLLHLAARNRRIDLVKYFVELNVKIDAITDTGDTALSIAFQGKSWKIVHYLLDLYLTQEISDSYSVNNALHIIIAEKSYNSQFKSLYEKYGTHQHSGLLVEAIRWKNIDLLKYLIQKKRSRNHSTFVEKLKNVYKK